VDAEAEIVGSSVSAVRVKTGRRFFKADKLSDIGRPFLTVLMVALTQNATDLLVFHVEFHNISFW
jgi:hypothetical protein